MSVGGGIKATTWWRLLGSSVVVTCKPLEIRNHPPPENVGSSPALGIIIPIFITPTTLVAMTMDAGQATR